MNLPEIAASDVAVPAYRVSQDAPIAEGAGSAKSDTRPVAYIMSRFPLLTETFILREMLELERRGLPLEVFPLLRAHASVRHEEVDCLKAAIHYTPFLSPAIILANASFLRRKPGRYLRLLWTILKGNWGSTNLFTGALGIFPKSVYFARLVEKHRVVHVHAHYATHPALCAMIISELAGVGYSFTAHAHDIFLEQRMLAEKVRKARFVAAISKHNKDFLLRLAPDVPPGKIEVVHCGIELEKYDALGRGSSDRLELPNKAITAICVASLQPYKGISYLISACERVARRVPNFRCIIVGQGADRAKLEALIDEKGLRQVVRLLGGMPQHQVATLLGEADLFVLPSIIAPSGQMEGIPVALMEAMASRLPVVSTRLSGIPELVDDGVNGILVPPEDDRALAEAIIALSGDHSLRREMGERGREKVAAEFELHATVESLFALFSDVASETEADPSSVVPKTVAAANDVDGGIVEWVGEQVSQITGRQVEVSFKPLGGGADSNVFEVMARDEGPPIGLILKLHRPGGIQALDGVGSGRECAENDFNALTYLWSVFSQVSTRLAVPRPVAVAPNHAALLMEKCPGVGLARAKRWSRFRRKSSGSLADWFEACGEWLAIFHLATKSDGDPSQTFSRMERDFYTDLDLCGQRGLDADLVLAATRRFEAEKSQAFDGRFGLVGRHCDFAPYNVLVSSDRVSVIDFEGLQQGLVYEDLCYFLGMHELTPPYHLSRSMTAALRKDFLRGYERHSALDRSAFEFFMLVATVKIMGNSPILRASTNWLALLKRQQQLRFYRAWLREQLS